METLENNEKKLNISMTYDDNFSVGNLLSNIEFFKLGFWPDHFKKIVDSALEQRFLVNEKVFDVKFKNFLFSNCFFED